MTELTEASQRALGIPTMRCFKRKNQIIFNCPECGQMHYHGIPSGKITFGREDPTGDDNGEGHRVSHCMEDAFPNGYILKLDPDEQARHDDQEGRIFALEERIARLEYKVAENFNMEEKEIIKLKEKADRLLF
tara:strand:- start:180 stop:578 length:399 start_codon:yes stop_codon:yes gene_type:complete